MEHTLNQIKREFVDALKKHATTNELQQLSVRYFGRKGKLTTALRQVKDIAETERPHIGKLANEIKSELETMMREALARVQSGTASDEHEALDATLPGIRKNLGHLHPITIVQQQLEDTFMRLGFMVLDGPEVESEYYNFTALNIPSDHPARDMQDTFWLTDGNLLRTQTSSVQVRALQKYGAPLRAVVPGRTFRFESKDASHDHTFYQMEGLMVDRSISISNLIAVMQMLLESIFQKKIELRLRPGYFPFVEPGFELDVRCLICGGSGCSVCKQIGWTELMPCGMVHPAVLKAGNVDPRHFSGLAFGLGLSRLVMMRYRINDIRLLLASDIRFLNQF